MNPLRGSHSDDPLRRLSTFFPFVCVGLGLCTVLESVFFGEFIRRGPLMLLFLWSYSQFAMVQIVAPSSGPESWPLQAVVWASAYVALALLLWAALRGSKILGNTGPWVQAFVGWAAVQCILAALAVGWVHSGLVDME